MAISIASKFWGGSGNLCRRYGSVHSGIWDDGIRFVTSHHRQYHHQQRRAYAFYFKGVGKPRNPKVDRVTCSALPSSSSGFLKWYLTMLETRPLITKGIPSSIIFAGADVTAQVITSTPSDKYDAIRTFRIAVYGLLIVGPSQHVWFNFLSKIFPKRDILSTLKKIMMGQVIYGPIINSAFFSYNAALRGETKEDIVARLKRDPLPTLKNGLIYWPFCDFFYIKIRSSQSTGISLGPPVTLFPIVMFIHKEGSFFFPVEPITTSLVPPSPVSLQFPNSSKRDYGVVGLPRWSGHIVLGSMGKNNNPLFCFLEY